MKRHYFPILLVLFPLAAARAQTVDALLDTVQHASFNFFWNEANPSNGLIRDRSTSGSPCSIASVGFGLTSICIGIDHGWITRQAGRDRVLTTLQTFWNGPQGSSSSGTIGYKGFFYHFLNMSTATRDGDSELSSIDSGLLLAGIIDAKQYFCSADSLDGVVRALADSIYYRVDWNWMRNLNPGILMGWKPGTQFGGYGIWIGYCEAMIMYILALGSPTHTVPASVWQAWTGGYGWSTYYSFSYVVFPPLFGHQYSHCWVDFRDIADTYMSGKGITYFENSRRATLAQRAYCIANTGGYAGYSDSLWGLTASDGPDGYNARGAPPNQNDDGTISPTAACGSLPFAPEVVIPAMRNMYNTYRASLWMKYGFRDAFNISRNWWDTDVIGIDEGPIVIMIENYRTQSVWNRCMQNADVQRGLLRAGFQHPNSVENDPASVPRSVILFQNYPNPFNPSTSFRFQVTNTAIVSLKVFDTAGQEIATIVAKTLYPGLYEIPWDAKGLSSGVYFYRLDAERTQVTKKLLILR